MSLAPGSMRQLSQSSTGPPLAALQLAPPGGRRGGLCLGRWWRRGSSRPRRQRPLGLGLGQRRQPHDLPAEHLAHVQAVLAVRVVLGLDAVLLVLQQQRQAGVGSAARTAITDADTHLEGIAVEVVGGIVGRAHV